MGYCAWKDESCQFELYSFFLISHFGTRGRQEHHQMRIEDFKVCYGIDGKMDVIEWMEGPTKTRQGRNLGWSHKSYSEQVGKNAQWELMSCWFQSVFQSSNLMVHYI